MQHSLVFFTLICQIAIGALIFREIFRLIPGTYHGTGIKNNTLIWIIVLLFFALFIAFFHLGNPVNAVNALNNLQTSWLSREIFFLCCLITSLILYVITGRYKSNAWIMSTLLFISVSSALLLLYSMVRLYMIPAVPSWNNLLTPVGFILAALSCGLGFILLFPGIVKQTNNNILLVLGFLVIAAVVNTVLYNSLPYKQLPVLLILRLLLSISAIVIISGKYLLIFPNKSGTWKVIVFVIITVSELMNRYIFFLSFEKSGL